jgi:hypothetical protein
VSCIAAAVTSPHRRTDSIVAAHETPNIGCGPRASHRVGSPLMRSQVVSAISVFMGSMRRIMSCRIDLSRPKEWSKMLNNLIKRIKAFFAPIGDWDERDEQSLDEKLMREAIDPKLGKHIELTTREMSALLARNHIGRGA